MGRPRDRLGDEIASERNAILFHRFHGSALMHMHVYML